MRAPTPLASIQKILSTIDDQIAELTRLRSTFQASIPQKVTRVPLNYEHQTNSHIARCPRCEGILTSIPNNLWRQIDLPPTSVAHICMRSPE